MPPCRMFLDADSLSQATSTSILGWRAGNALLGCIASMDEHRRILLVTKSEDAYLISDLTMPHKQGGHERPRIGMNRLPWQHSCDSGSGSAGQANPSQTG